MPRAACGFVQTERIELAMPAGELQTLAVYCVNRVEENLGPPDSWFVRVGAVEDGWRARS